MTLTLPILTRRRHGVLTDAQRVAELFRSGAQGAWYDPSDFSTLYQNAAGTTPVTAVEQPVRLMLDKSKGLVLGSELVTNGDFSDGTTGWSTPIGATLTVISGVAKCEMTTDGAYFGQTINFVAGRTYEIVFSSISDGTSKPFTAFIGTTIGSSNRFSGTSAGLPYAFGVNRTFYYQAVATESAVLWFYSGGLGGALNYILADNISVRELPGNHARAPNDASRPVLRARYNLLTRTEEFDNGAWSKVGVSVSSVAGVTNIVRTTDGYNAATQNILKVAVAQVYTISFEAKPVTGNFVTVTLQSGVGAAQRVGFSVNVATGTVSTAPSAAGSFVAGALTIGSQTSDGYYPIAFSCTTDANATLGVYIAPSAVTRQNVDNTVAGSSPAEAQFRKVSLLTAADVAATGNAYQRVGAATDYDTGPPWRPYLAFDGSDDSMSTSNIDFATVTSDGQPRRNLLVNPTQFDAAGWTKQRTTVTANAVTAPDGTTTADAVFETAESGTHGVYQSITKAASATTYAVSCYVKPNGRDWAILQLNGPGETNRVRVWFDLSGSGAVGSNVAAGTGFSFVSASIQSLADGWYRCTTVITGDTATSHTAFIRTATGDTLDSYVGDITKGLYIWGAQLEIGSTATEFQNLGTDKMTVFAGVSKLSDAAFAGSLLVELTVSSATENGAFDIFAPDNFSPRYYLWRSKGTTRRGNFASSAIYAAPVTNVLTGIGDISGDVATLRINGAQIVTDTGDQGSGNYANAPLYIGSRGGSFFPFNGRLYGLTVLGRTATAEELAHTERTIAIASGFSAPTFSGDLNIGIS